MILFIAMIITMIGVSYLLRKKKKVKPSMLQAEITRVNTQTYYKGREK